MSSSSFLAGVPVEVDPRLIERELAALWKPASEATDGDEAVVRVCVSNLVVFLDDPARLEEASRTLERLSRRRPNRTIILLVSDEGDEDDDDPGDGISSRLRARLSAICHRPLPGGAAVCCERIVLTARPDHAELLPGALAPLLVPDIPVHVWWLGRTLASPLLPPIADAADRIVVDSRLLPPSRAFEELSSVVSEHPEWTIFDLGWRSTLAWRSAIADVFDAKETRKLLSSLRRIEVIFRSRSGSRELPAASILLAGWIAARLGFTPERLVRAETGSGFRSLARDENREIEIAIREADHDASDRTRDDGDRVGPLAPLVSVSFHARTGERGSSIAVMLEGKELGSARVSWRASGECPVPQVFAFPEPRAFDLLADTLEAPPLVDSFVEALGAAKALEVDRSHAKANAETATIETEPSTEETP